MYFDFYVQSHDHVRKLFTAYFCRQLKKLVLLEQLEKYVNCC